MSGKDDKVRGRPFEPGVSGNPAGRPRKIARYVATIRKFEPRILKALIATAVDPDHRDHVSAAKVLLAYSRGNPRQQVEVTGKDGGPLDLSVDTTRVLSDPKVREAVQASMLAGTVTTTEQKP